MWELSWIFSQIWKSLLYVHTGIGPALAQRAWTPDSEVMHFLILADGFMDIIIMQHVWEQRRKRENIPSVYVIEMLQIKMVVIGIIVRRCWNVK